MTHVEGALDRRELAPSLIVPVGRLTPHDFDKISANLDAKRDTDAQGNTTKITLPKATIINRGDGTLSILGPHYQVRLSDTFIAVSRKGFLAFVEATQVYGLDCNDVITITKAGIDRQQYPQEEEMDVDVSRARSWSVSEQVTKQHNLSLFTNPKNSL